MCETNYLLLKENVRFGREMTIRSYEIDHETANTATEQRHLRRTVTTLTRSDLTSTTTTRRRTLPHRSFSTEILSLAVGSGAYRSRRTTRVRKSREYDPVLSRYVRRARASIAPNNDDNKNNNDENNNIPVRARSNAHDRRATT